MSDLVPVTSGPPATSSSSPAPVPATITQRPAGGSPWGIVAFLSLVLIAAITIWKVHVSKTTSSGAPTDSGSRVKTVWNGIILALIVSALTDLDKGLGAAFGGSIVMFMLFKELPSISGAFKSPVPPSTASTGGATGGTGTTGLPPGSYPADRGGHLSFD